jgi:hypothetical protein
MCGKIPPLVAAFAHSLRDSLASLNLKAEVVDELESNVPRLGGLNAPPGVDPQTAARIRTAVERAFVFGFRVIMLLCASLAVAGAAVAWLKIPGPARVA